MGQTPRELTPTRSAAHALGAELRRRRLDRGLSQAGLGALVHHSGALIGKIEKAERIPSAEFCDLVDAVLDAGGLFAGLRLRVDPEASVEYACFGEPTWSVDTSLRALRELNGGAVDRRDFLALTGTALAAVGARWSEVVATSRPADCALGGRLGRATLDRLAQRLADLRQLDDELGGTVLCDIATAELRWLTGLVESTSRDGPEECELLGLVAEAARLCGWLHFDAGRHAAAQAYYVTALRCSASGAHPLTGANVLAGMSFQATMGGRPHEALELLDSAEQRLGTQSCARLRALLASRRARAHARAGDSRGCGHALNQAERELDAAESEHTAPAWIYFFDEAELAAQAGACWVDLRKPDCARPLLDDALGTIGSQFVRDRTIYHVRSAQSHIQGRELELACADLSAAAELVRQTGSARSLDVIQSARREMSGYDGEQIVHELDELLLTANGRASTG